MSRPVANFLTGIAGVFLVLAIFIPLVAGTSAQAIQDSHVVIVNGASSLTSTAYSPDIITVVIGVNNTVIWTNNDTIAHTVTGTNSSAFHIGNINPGASGTYTFTVAGRYPYHCSYHPNMVGEIIVLPAPAAASTTSQASTSQQTTSAPATSTTGVVNSMGVPEFPPQLGVALLTSAFLAVAYVALRRPK